MVVVQARFKKQFYCCDHQDNNFIVVIIKTRKPYIRGSINLRHMEQPLIPTL